MTTASAPPFPDFVAIGQGYFAEFKTQLAAYGLEVDPALEVRRKSGLMGYYHLGERCIYLSFPDLSMPEGKLHLMVLRSLLACSNNKELSELLSMLVPHVLAHEMAHHLRHHYGTWNNSWQEEHIANQVAVALTRHLHPPAMRAHGLSMLRRAVKLLAERLGIPEDLAIHSYHDLAQAFETEGTLSDAVVNGGQLMQVLFALHPDTILNEWAIERADVRRALEARAESVEAFTNNYHALVNDLARYTYYLLWWMYLDISSDERPYLSNLAQRYFNRPAPLLPAIDDHRFMGEKAILACYQAALTCRTIRPAAADYFYKRYRATFLAMLQVVDMNTPEQTQRVRAEARFLLQSWSGQHDEPDLLNYLIEQSPYYVQEFFPERIAKHPDLDRVKLPEHLPAETDRRLWQHLHQACADPSAAQTLTRLDALYRVELYRALPASVLMEVVHSVNPIFLQPGDALIWEGEANQDMYIVAAGQLELTTTQNGAEVPINLMQPGDMIGVVAFFTKRPRVATARALTPVECYALSRTALQILGFKYPVIMSQIARVLAERLSHTLRTNR